MSIAFKKKLDREAITLGLQPHYALNTDPFRKGL